MAISDEDPAVASLKEAFAKARAQAQLCPVQDRIAHTEAFLDRSRKKMEAQSAVVSRIQEIMAELTIKIQDGTSRLEGLKAEARVQPSPFTVPIDPQEEIRSLRARIAQMEGSMDGDVWEAKRVKICATCPDVAPICRSGPRLREDFVPGSKKEATLVGNGQEVARLCPIMGNAAASWSTVSVTPSMVSNAVR